MRRICNFWRFPSQHRLIINILNCSVQLLQYLRDRGSKYAPSLVIIYIPLLALSVNILVIKNPVVGTIFTFLYLLISAESLHNAFQKMFFRERISLRISSIVLLLFSMVSPMSPFMITESIRPLHVVLILLLSGLPISILKIRFATHKQNEEIESVDFRSPISALTKWASLAFLSLLVIDIIWLLRTDVNGYGLISDVIPPAHFYIISAATGLLILLILSRIRAGIKISLILLYGVILHLTWSLLAPTPVGVDPWSLVGDTNASIFGSDRFSSGTYPHHLVNFGPLEIPDWVLLRIGVAIPYTTALFLQQLTQIDMIQLSPWIGPVIYAILGRGVLFQVGRAISLQENYPFILMMIGSFYPLFTVFGNETLKLTLVMPFFLLGIYIWLRYLATKEKKYLYAGLTLTALNIFSYSLFFVTLIQLMVIAILLTKFDSIKAKASHLTVLAVIASVSLMLIMLVPIIDTLFETHIAFPEDIPSTIRHYVSVLGGSEGPVKDYRQLFAKNNSFVFADNSLWIFLNIFVWALTLIGIVKNTFSSRPIYYFLVWFFIITHTTYYITEFGLVGQRPLGAHMGQITEIARFPFFAAGLSVVTSYFKKISISTIVKNKYRRTAILALSLILIIASLSVAAANAVEIQTFWLGISDVEAARYIVNKVADDDIHLWSTSIVGSGHSVIETDYEHYKVGNSSIKSTFYATDGSKNTITFKPPNLDLSRRDKLEFWIMIKASFSGESIPIHISLSDKAGNVQDHTLNYPSGGWRKITLDYSDLIRYHSNIKLDALDHVSLSFKATGSEPIIVWLDSVDPSGGFVLITQDLSTWPVYAMTNGNILMGGFNDPPTLGSSPVTKTSTLYWDLRFAPSVEKLDSISRNANVCTIFLQVSSYSLSDDGRLGSTMDGPVQFVSHDDRATYRTSLYWKHMC